MSTFAQLIAKPGVGVAYYFDVSLDRFSTVSYRYGQVAGKLDGTNEYTARVLSLGNLARELGADNVLTTSTIDVTLDNTDAGADWLSDRSTVATSVFRSQWRLGICAFDPANPSDYATKTLGIFTPFEFPQREWGSVRLTLGDRNVGDASEFALTPTLRDIFGDLYTEGIFSTSNPDTCAEELLLDPDVPLPLAFGSGRNVMPVQLVCRPQEREDVGGLFGVGPHAFVVCCTSATSAPAIEGYQLWSAHDGYVAPVPNSLFTGHLLGNTTVKRSSTVTKDGKSWQVVWVKWDSIAWQNQPVVAGGDANKGIPKFESTEPPYVMGFPYSSRTYDTPATTRDGRVTGPDVAYDLLRYYSRGLTSGDVDSASFTAAKRAVPTDSVFGRIDPGQFATQVSTTDATQGTRARKTFEAMGGALRSTISELCSSAAFDVFVAWSGLFYAMTNARDFASQTGTFLAFDEMLIKSTADFVPSHGQRWAPFNRLYVETAGGTQGPFEFSAVATWERIQPHTVRATWASLIDTTARQWATEHGLDGQVRPVLRFRYPLTALTIELGDYVTCGWTRAGRGTPYAASTIWRVEGLTLSPGNAELEVTLVWMGDLRTDAPYLLDDETLLTRCSGSGGRTCTLTTGSDTVTFSSGDLATDGVAVGDTLIVLDSTEVDGTFLRNRVLLITLVGATSLKFDTALGAGTAFGTGGPFTLSTWEIRRGATTYHTSSSDPTNYPSDGAMYGKVSAEAADTYSDASAANKLLNG